MQNNKKGYYAKDSIGRKWFVSNEAVREDYIESLQQIEEISKEEAASRADTTPEGEGWRAYWFEEQIAPDPYIVFSLGELVEDISKDEKQALIDALARQEECVPL